MDEWKYFVYLFAIQPVMYCKVNFVLNLTKHYVMKTYVEVNV
jgi:hypothetical protein